MTPRNIEPPTVNEHGDDVHPAFGMIRASRISYGGGGGVLFDSDIQHQHTVRIVVEPATRKRDLNRDWIHGGSRQLIEVELSEAQWASFVSSMNTSGVPCTIRATESDWNVPELPYDPRLAHSMAEVKDAASKTFAKIAEALAKYEAVLESGAGVKDRRQALRDLHFAVKNTEANLSFAAESLSEHAENVVQKARADIEAMVSAEANRLGLTQGEAKGVLALPAFEGEEPD